MRQPGPLHDVEAVAPFSPAPSGASRALPSELGPDAYSLSRAGLANRINGIAAYALSIDDPELLKTADSFLDPTDGRLLRDRVGDAREFVLTFETPRNMAATGLRGHEMDMAPPLRNSPQQPRHRRAA